MTVGSPETAAPTVPTAHGGHTVRAGDVNASADGVATHCAYCGLQCAMSLSGDSADTLTVRPRRFPTNRGGLCQKGWTSAELLRTPGRLTTPLVRRDGELRPASWDEALGLVAETIVRIFIT